ncbi:DUF4114 domain-containing protein [Calothrix membranacea FACHB-236]|nr:DUF4114 domain-containing protein [Calothrix membranacea FACHB-236]
MKLSDLLVSDVSASGSAFIGEKIPVSWTVKNLGEETTTNNFWVGSIFLSTDENLDKNDDISLNDWSEDDSIALESQGSYEVNTEIYIPTTTPGNYYLLFATDNDDNETEADETNNVYAHPLEVKFPDIAGNISANNGSINGVLNTEDIRVENKYYELYQITDFKPGDFITVNLTSYDFNTDLFLFNKSTLQEIKIYDDFGGGTGSQLSFVAQDNIDYIVQVSSDQDDGIGNYTLSATSKKAPDLVVENATAPESAILGENINVSWTVKNQGSVSTTANWADYIYLSDDDVFDVNDRRISSLWADNNTPLASNTDYTESKNITIPNDVNTGNYFLIFATDKGDYNSNGNQGETDETNNTLAKQISISAPDLIVENATIPKSAILGENISVSWSVKNQGSVTAPADWYDYVYLSTDNVLDFYDTEIGYSWEKDNSPLASNNSYTVTQNITIPKGVNTGNYYLIFTTDKTYYGSSYGNQGETDETNNTLAKQISIVAPDLVVSDASATSSNVVLGQTFSVSWTVANQGSSDAPADWYDSIYLSTDAQFDISDIYLNTRLAGENTPLAGGTDYTATQNITIPNKIATGSYYLLFITDKHPFIYNYDNLQAETDETNNVRSLEINVAAPDLEVTSATTPTTAGLGETVEVSWTVTNQGISEAPTDWFDYIYLSDDQILDNNDTLFNSYWVRENTPLAAGASYTATQNVAIPTQTATGNRYLLFVADGSKSQGETNENNNVYAAAITLGLPDLVVNTIKSPEQVSWGETVEISWTVENTGDSVAPANWYDSVYISDDEILDDTDKVVTSYWTDSNTSLEAGDSYTATQNIDINSSLGTGDRYLLFVTDNDDNQDETDESNNIQAVAINISAPDLEITAATSPKSAAVGETVELSWTVTNQGDGAAIADWFDDIYLSDDQVFDNNDRFLKRYEAQENTPLAASASYTATQSVTIPTQTATGDRYLLFVADGSKSQAENNENNNVYAAAITLGLPDLVVSTTTSLQQVTWGETVEISWTVENTSSFVAPANWFDSVYISDNEILDDKDKVVTDPLTGSNSPLAPGDSYTATRNIDINSSLGTGDRYLLFVVDGSKSQGETDETNNVQAVAINISAPDLEITTATAPVSADLGETIELSWTVANQGDAAATADWYDSVYLSTDAKFDISDTYLTTPLAAENTPLAAGADYTTTQNITIPNNIVTGSYYLLFVTDKYFNYYDNRQIEADETNNVKAVPIQLGALDVDLVVSDVSAPIEALTGQEIEIAWTVTNQGTENATGTWTDYIYLSDDTNVGNDQFYGSFLFTGTIAGGESIERRQSITLPDNLSGDRYLIVRTDANNQLLEYGKENNNTTVDNQAILVSAFHPNLQVTKVTAPETAFSSQETVIEWTVTNNGNGATSTPIWYDKVWLSLDQTFDDSDIYLGRATNSSYLNVGESYNNSLTVKLPRGIDSNYYFLVKTDADNQVSEFQNEEDNFGVSNPTDVDLTPPPDLQVTSVNAPSQGFSGQTMSLSWVVTNQGTGRTLEESWYDEIIMSADEMIDENDYRLGRLNHTGVLNAGESYTATQDVTLPVGVSGNFYVFISTDSGDGVFESVFESNNTGFDDTPTTINLTPPPDLEVESVDVPTTARAGDKLTINYRVTNFGATETPNSFWTDTFYLSIDDKLDVDSDERLGDISHFGNLDAGASYDNSASFTLDHQLTGDYYVFVATDSSNSVFELDNDNNTAFDATPVTIASQPADLIVSEVISPTSAEAGKAIRVNWTVKNQGTGNSIATSWYDQVVLSADTEIGNNDDIRLNWFTHEGLLDTGDSYNRSGLVEIPFNVVGDYNLFVVTDTNKNVYEAAENNNFTAKSITITRQTPDLQVTEVTVNSATGLTADKLTVNWTVQNLGAGQTNSNFWYDKIYLSADENWDINDSYLGEFRRANTLAANEQYDASETFTVPFDAEGEFYVIVRTDADKNQVLEASLENNNDGVSADTITFITNPNPDPDLLSINVPPQFSPDLIVDSVDAPTQGVSGQSLEVSWTVNNQRYSTGKRSWYDAVYLSRDQIFDREDDIYLGSHFQNNLAAGDSYTVTKSFDIPRGLSGSYYIFVATDAGDKINEPDGESNNIAYDRNPTQITLPAPADFDLVAGTIKIPANGVPGQNATIEYTVENRSSEAVIGNWYDSIYISADDKWDINDSLFAQVQVFESLESGESYSKTVNAALPGVLPGNYHVIIRSDIRNNVPELDESNNLGASLDQFALDAELLELGTPDTGTLGQGQAVYYRIDVGAGETLRVKLDSNSTTAANELYLSYGEIPTRSQFDFGFTEAFAPDQDILIPTTEEGVYYVLAYGANLQGEPAPFSIIAETVDFGIFDIDQKEVGNGGYATLKIRGAKLDNLSSISLQAADGSKIEAKNIELEDSTTAYVTFNLDGLELGQYDIIASNESNEISSLEDILEVAPAQTPELALQITTPPALRPGQKFTATVTYANLGNNDTLQPLLFIDSNEFAKIALTPGNFEETSLSVLTNSSEGLRGILRPGESGTLQIFGQISPNAHPGSSLDLQVNVIGASNNPIDFEQIENSYPYKEIYGDKAEDFLTILSAVTGETNQEFLANLHNSAAALEQYSSIPVSFEEIFYSQFGMIEYIIDNDLLDEILKQENNLSTIDSFAAIEAFSEANLYVANSTDDNPNVRIKTVYQPDDEECNSERVRYVVWGFTGSEDYKFDPNSNNPNLNDPNKSNAPAMQMVRELHRIYPNDTIKVVEWPSGTIAGLIAAGLSGAALGGIRGALMGTVIGADAAILTYYAAAAAATRLAGKKIAEDIKNNYKPDKVTIYGYSLGAQAAGFAGEELGDNVLGKIVAFDPAGPLFGSGISGNYALKPLELYKDGNLPENRLDPDDAVIVEAIHASKVYGQYRDVGDDGYNYYKDNRRFPLLVPEILYHEGSHQDYLKLLRSVTDGEHKPEDCDDENSSSDRDPDLSQKYSSTPPNYQIGPKPTNRDAAKPDKSGNGKSPIVRAVDPNDIIGPKGFGDENWIASNSILPYTIRFENVSTATAPAQTVTITHPLDTDLDWRTFRLGSFGWGGLVFQVPENRSFYQQRIDLTEDYGFYVDVFASIDINKGEASWTITTIDPQTGEAPQDALAGFLPPNNEDGVGDGFVTYTIRPDRNAQTGDVIDAKATIVFDTEEPIDTPPIFNTLDATSPTSTVAALPAKITDENGEFTVNWGGSDDEQGSGIAGYTVYVSENGGNFKPWLEDTTLTEASYIGEAGKKYAFYVVAKDNAGNTQEIPTQAQATTRIAGGTATIGDFVWVDTNGNGIQDTGEPGLEQVTVNLYDNGETLVSTTTTKTSGFYSFTEIDPGDYFLEFIAPTSYLFTPENQGDDDITDSDVNQTTGKTLIFTVEGGEDYSNWDAGLYQLATISGQKFHDIDSDSVKDTNESGLAGWTIYLDTNQNGELDDSETSTQTDANGNYSFNDLVPGTYTVAEVMQSGWQQTFPGNSSVLAQSITTTASDALIYTPSTPITTTDTALTTTASSLINLNAFRNDPRFTNIDGSGLTSVIIDTGIDLNHPFFGADKDGNGIADRIVYQYDFANNDTNASDVNGHGSHVASIIASSDSTYTGIAPKADIIALKVFKDSGSGYFSDLEESLQWVIDNADTYNIASVNLSVGDEQNWNTRASRYGIGDELAALAGMGIIVTSAAGNNFAKFDSKQGLAYPAADPNVIAVGAVWENTDQIADFSQRHQTMSDIFAPGIPIEAANANGGVTTKGGTSQAAPYVAGIAVLAQQIAIQKLGRKLSVDEFRYLLETTSVTINDGDDEKDNVINTGLDFSRVDILALAEEILNFNGEVSNPDSVQPDTNSDNTSLYIPNNVSGLVHTVTVKSGETVTNLNFGNQKLNQTPELAVNNGLTLNEEDTAVITHQELQVTDADNTASEITYILTDVPDNGILRLNGSQLAVDNTLTQDDIDNERLEYLHNGSETNSDRFSFRVTDGKNGNIDTTDFQITVNPVNDAPTLENAIANQTATENATFTFTIPENTFNDVDAGDEITYAASLDLDSALPTWLNFNPSTRTFRGTPTNSDVGTFNITLLATDKQGVTVSDTFTITVEEAVNTDFDGNQDGKPDIEQPNVLSLKPPTDNTEDILTFFSQPGSILKNAKITENPAIDDSDNPENKDIDFPVDFFNFELEGLTPGTATTVNLLLPQDQAYNTFWKYGKTPDNNQDHWYEFLYDGETGAQFIDTNDDGKADQIVLHFVDGKRGDADLTANGAIINSGAPGVTNNSLILSKANEDVWEIEGKAGAAVAKFSLLDKNSKQVNEVGVFKVDAYNRVNGIAPGEAGFAKVALQQSEVIFSALADDLLNNIDLTRKLQVGVGERLAFYFISNGTADSALSKNNFGNVFFSINQANPNSKDYLQVSETNGVYTLNWEQGNDNSFNDLVMKFQLENTPLNTQNLIGNYQGEKEGELINLESFTDREVKATFTLYSEAAYNNFVGFYKVDDAQGSITDELTGKTLKPGDAGYAELVVKQRIPGVELSVGNNQSITIEDTLEGGYLFAPFIIANGNAGNINANYSEIYTPYILGNSDKVDHIRLLGDNIFGFEDLRGGGDNDFNDIIIKANFQVM